ncbi:MAG: hypothetical protein ACI90V_010748, partial [Bacillariaceae sp.]
FSFLSSASAVADFVVVVVEAFAIILVLSLCVVVDRAYSSPWFKNVVKLVGRRK